MRVILASGSPRRKELMDMLGINYEIIVSNADETLEKGLSFEEQSKKLAYNMLNSLKNNKHQVFTSLAILIQNDEVYEEYIDCNITDVYISDMNDEEIQKWIDSGEAYDKAGAYAIQSNFTKFIQKIDGNYNAVIGLPVNKVYNILKNYIDI